MARQQNKMTRPPPGVPVWIDQALVEQTIAAWQPYYREPLTEADAVEMLISVGNLVSLLGRSHQHPDG